MKYKFDAVTQATPSVSPSTQNFVFLLHQ